MSGPYDDILYCKRPVSFRHPPMAVEDRAAQFAPFAALTGYDSALDEVSRITQNFICLDESEQSEVDHRLRCAESHQIPVQLTVFVPDQRKEGGAYKELCGTIRRIDPVNGIVHMMDRQSVPLAQIVHVVLLENTPGGAI